jgi:hypothetical protein
MKDHLIQLSHIDHFAALLALVEVLSLLVAQCIEVSGIHLGGFGLRSDVRRFTIIANSTPRNTICNAIMSIITLPMSAYSHCAVLTLPILSA